MKILVTGGAGFIGSHVVDEYLKCGHEVVVLDDLSRGRLSNVSPAAHFYRCDVRDPDEVSRIVAAEKPDIINHHAAQMDVRRGVREPVFDAQVNILGSLNLLEAAVASHVQRVIYISTAGAGYGEPDRFPVPEDYPINPITPYGVSKHTVEHYLFTFSHLYGISYVVLRYGNVYGPRQNAAGEAGVFAIFSEQMLSDVQPVIYGDGSKVRDYVYVNDVAQANVAALTQGVGGIFNIGSGEGTTDYDVFRLVKELVGKATLEPRYLPKRPGEIDRICLDISRAARRLNWKPATELQDGARTTVDYFKEQQKLAPASLAG
jgi:UDP-glucose 4-epimerase